MLLCDFSRSVAVLPAILHQRNVPHFVRWHLQGDVVSSLVNSAWDSLSGSLCLDKSLSFCELDKRWEAQCSGPILVYINDLPWLLSQTFDLESCLTFLNRRTSVGDKVLVLCADTSMPTIIHKWFPTLVFSRATTRVSLSTQFSENREWLFAVSDADASSLRWDDVSSPWITEFSCERVEFVLPGWDTPCELSQPWSSTKVTTGRGYERTLLAVEYERLLGYPAALTSSYLTALAKHNKPALQDCASIESTRISFLTGLPHAKSIDMLIDRLCGPSWNVYHREPPTLCHTDPLWCRGAYAQAVFDLRSLCPYLLDRKIRGLPCDVPLGPDSAEQNLHRMNYCGDFSQSKRQTYAAGYVSLLPRGLSPSNYALCAAVLPSRLLEDPDLPDDLQFAIRFSTGHCGVEVRHVRKWRRRQLRELKRIVFVVEGRLHEETFAPLDSTGTKMLKQALQPARVALAAAGMNWPDHDVALLSCAGSDIVGKLQHSFIFRAADVTLRPR